MDERFLLIGKNKREVKNCAVNVLCSQSVRFGLQKKRYINEEYGKVKRVIHLPFPQELHWLVLLTNASSLHNFCMRHLSALMFLRWSNSTDIANRHLTSNNDTNEDKTLPDVDILAVDMFQDIESFFPLDIHNL